MPHCEVGKVSFTAFYCSINIAYIVDSSCFAFLESMPFLMVTGPQVLRAFAVSSLVSNLFAPAESTSARPRLGQWAFEFQL
jgi:hypothetical protein